MMIPIGIYVIHESQWWCDGIMHVCCPQGVGFLEVTGAQEEDEITLHTIFQTENSAKAAMGRIVAMWSCFMTSSTLFDKSFDASMESHL